MTKITGKRWGIMAAALIISVLLGVFTSHGSTLEASVKNTARVSLVNQKITGITLQPKEVTKMFYKNQLIGIIYDRGIINDVKERLYRDFYAKDFPDSEISLDENVYLYTEKTYLEYENKDSRIALYLYENDLFLVDAYRISIGDSDVIYVKSLDDFRSALRTFVLNFINEDVYIKLEKNENIATLTAYGEQDVSVSIEQQIISTKTKAAASDIFKNTSEIISYLCYGRDTEMKYYTVARYDTVNGVASKNGMTAEQVVMINDSVKSVNSILTEGTQLNVTPFNSPLNVIVERERFVKEVIYQPGRTYERDESKPAGYVEVVQEGRDGSQDCLYKEIYVNGILTSYKLERKTITQEAVGEVIRVGIGAVGNSNSRFRLPVNNPHLICDYYCYEGHNGADFQDRYERWGKIYACADGVIISNGYGSLSGWHYMVDHGNGYTFRYSHMRTRGFLTAGTEIVMSQYIGDIGMTGLATAPHVHVAIYINGVNVDPCTVLPCELGR